MKAFVSTHPFSLTSSEPMRILEENEIDVRLNLLEHKISTDELVSEIRDADVLIAGTERITESVLKNAPNLKLISRVGIGLDGIDFELCRKYNVRVTYTPDAPTLAVAELCVGMILDLARKISETNRSIKQGFWYRHMGMLLHGKKIGILGMGRIGKSLIHLLAGFNVEFLVHDRKPDIAFGRLYNVRFLSKHEVLRYSDIVSVNLPLNRYTYNYLALEDLLLMQSHALLINTARGGVVNERDLYDVLNEKIIHGAAVDVFENEPYSGALTALDNCILTCHMGASTRDSRTNMEVEAVKEVVRFKNSQPLENEVFENA